MVALTGPSSGTVANNIFRISYLYVEDDDLLLVSSCQLVKTVELDRNVTETKTGRIGGGQVDRQG
jgi:hypothetical protein